MKTVLVTGGAGYIASHTIVELLQAGDYDVIVVDNLINAVGGGDQLPVSLQRVEKITGKKVTFYEADLLVENGLDTIFEKHSINCVIHFAALKAVGESVAEPLKYYKNNLCGAMYLLETCKRHNVKSLVFSSSATVYGLPQYLPIDEKHQAGVGITNPYGKTKYFIEQILADLAASDSEWDIIALRYFNPVGSHPSGLIGEDPRGVPNNLMPYVAQVAVGKLPYVKVFGTDYNTPDGTGVRDYIHITDLAKGHLAALKKIDEKCKFKVYNLGTGRGYSVIEMIKALELASRKKVEFKSEARREGDLASIYCCTKLAEDELKWKAELGLDQMCKDLWNWQSKNPTGYQTN